MMVELKTKDDPMDKWLSKQVREMRKKEMKRITKSISVVFSEMKKIRKPMLIAFSSCVIIAVMVWLFLEKREEARKSLALQSWLNQTEKIKISLKSKLKEVTIAKQAINEELNNTKNSLKEITEEFDSLEADFDKVKEELSKTTQEKAELEEKLESITKELAKHKGNALASEEELKKQKEANISLQEELEDVVEEQLDVEKELDDAIKERLLLEKMIGTVRSETKVVIAETSKPPPKNIMGRVLTVDIEHNFVVVSVGEKDNVASGMVFTVYGNDKIKGKLKIEKVYKNMSIAAITHIEHGKEIKENDKIGR